MSINTYTRSEIYQQWQEKEPEIAKKFYNPDMNPLIYTLSTIAVLFSMVLVGSIASAGINSLTNSVFLVGGVMLGAAGLAGVINCAIIQCKKVYLSNQRLTAREVNKIAGEDIVDSRPENLNDL